MVELLYFAFPFLIVIFKSIHFLFKSFRDHSVIGLSVCAVRFSDFSITEPVGACYQAGLKICQPAVADAVFQDFFGAFAVIKI